jgi:hypothetical protein
MIKDYYTDYDLRCASAIAGLVGRVRGVGWFIIFFLSVS